MSTTNPQISVAPENSSRRLALSMALIIFIVTLLVFGAVVRHEFVHWDDGHSFAGNPDFLPPTPALLGRIWLHPTHGYNGLYVPVNYTVWWALASVAHEPGPSGTGVVLEPAAFHALNLLFHAGCSVMVFLVLRRLVNSDVPAALGALLFAVHPLQVEPVSWASTMYTPLSGLLALLALWLYQLYSDRRDAAEDSGSMRARLYLGLAALSFAVALLTKPTVVVMPLVVAVVETLLRRKPLKSCAPLLLWLLLGAVDALITRNIHTGMFAYRPELLARPLIATDALAFYMTKLVAPVNLVTDYGRTPLWVLQHRSVWLMSLIPLAAIASAILMRRRTPWLTAGVAIFVLGPAAMLGLTPFNFQHFSTVSDRYAYLSLFGAAIVLAYFVRISADRGWRIVVPATVAALVGLALLSRSQTAYWHDTVALFGRTLDVNPTSLAAHGNLGEYLLEFGTPDATQAAVEHFRAAADSHPDDPVSREALGNQMVLAHRYREAAALFADAARIGPQLPAPRYLLGCALTELHDRDRAIAAFTRTLELSPNYYDADLRLGDLLASAGRTSEAAVRYQIILQNHPEAQFVRERLQRLNAQAGVELR